MPATLGVTTYDVRVFGRALVMGCVLAVLAYGIMLATDGATTTTAGKLARLGVLAPVLGTLASALANAQARARGEVRALVTSGASPARCYAGAMAASLVIGCAGAAMIGSAATDLGGLFPRLEHAHWIRLTNGTWQATRAGILVAVDGSIAFVPAQLAAATPPSRHAVMAAVLLASAALPVWAERGGSLVERLAVGALAVVAGVVLFHFVGAARLSAWSLIAVPTAILLHTIARVRWQARLEREGERSRVVKPTANGRRS
jgi:hypothetical protein